MNLIGEISALTAAILWSFSSILFTSLSIQIGTLQLNLWRLVFAAILLAITLQIANIPFDITTSQFIYLSLSGIVGLVLGDTFLFAGFKEIGPRLSMLLMSSNPAIAAVIAYIIFNESLSITGIIGMIVTLSGIYIVINQKTKNQLSRFNINLKGIIFGFLAAAGQATGLIFAKLAFVQGDINSLAATQVRIVMAILFLFPAMVVMRRFANPVQLFGKNTKLMGKVLLGSIIGPYLGITLSYIAITNTQIGIASTLMSVTPITIIPLSILFYKEKLSVVTIIGTTVAVIGIALLFLH